VSYTGLSGMAINYPAAELVMIDGENTVTFEGYETSFTTMTPLVGEAQSPFKMMVNESRTILITISNRSPQSIDGTLRVLITDVNGVQQYQTYRNLTVSGSGDLSTTMEVKAPGNEGYYILNIYVESNGGRYDISNHFLEVIQAHIYMPLIQR
jgi:hypothetical protein